MTGGNCGHGLPGHRDGFIKVNRVLRSLEPGQQRVAQVRQGCGLADAAVGGIYRLAGRGDRLAQIGQCSG